MLIGTYFGLTFTLTGPIWSTIPIKPSAPVAVGGAVLYPFLCAISGIISGFITGWLYNFVARFLVGLVIDVDQGDSS